MYLPCGECGGHHREREACMTRCGDEQQCRYWTWEKSRSECTLKVDAGTPRVNPGLLSSPKHCGARCEHAEGLTSTDALCACGSSALTSSAPTLGGSITKCTNGEYCFYDDEAHADATVECRPKPRDCPVYVGGGSHEGGDDSTTSAFACACPLRSTSWPSSDGDNHNDATAAGAESNNKYAVCWSPRKY